MRIESAEAHLFHLENRIGYIEMAVAKLQSGLQVPQHNVGSYRVPSTHRGFAAPSSFGGEAHFPYEHGNFSGFGTTPVPGYSQANYYHDPQ